MRFDVTSGTRLRATMHEALRSGRQNVSGIGDGRAHVTDQQHQSRQQALHEAGGVGTVALSRSSGKVGLLGCGGAHQRGDVVGQDFGGDVDDQGLLAQARDGFEVQSVFEPFECFFDAPALVVEVAEQRSVEALSVQVGGEHADTAIGRCLSHQAQVWSPSRAPPIAHIVATGRVQRHASLGGTRAKKRLGGAPAAIVVATHDEADTARVEQGHQPGRRIAAVEHQHIVGAEQIQRLDEHASLGHEAAVHAGVQRQLGTRQEQREQALVRLCRRACIRNRCNVSDSRESKNYHWR